MPWMDSIAWTAATAAWTVVMQGISAFKAAARTRNHRGGRQNSQLAC